MFVFQSPISIRTHSRSGPPLVSSSSWFWRFDGLRHNLYICHQSAKQIHPLYWLSTDQFDHINLFSSYRPDLDLLLSNYRKHFPCRDQAEHNKLIKRWGICLGESYFREYTFFLIGSVVYLVVITTPMPSLYNCHHRRIVIAITTHYHHYIIAIIMILIIISMRKRQDKWENPKVFELLIATLTRTELHWPPVTIRLMLWKKN